MLAAFQSLYRDASIFVKVNGHVGDSMGTTNGVRQGCPLSPTLFGIYIDSLEGWLREQVPVWRWTPPRRCSSARSIDMCRRYRPL